MISKTNGLIDYMNNNTKVIQLWKEHFTYDLPSRNLISFFPSGAQQSGQSQLASF